MSSTWPASKKRGNALRGYGSGMGSWYWIGVSAGLGTAWGIAGRPPRELPSAVHLAIGTLAAAGGGALAGWFVHRGHWADPVVGAAGAAGASLGAAVIVSGALRRGGTRGGIAVIVIGFALVAAGIAFIPAAGYLEALALPALAARLRRTQPERYAGLRTLARD